MELLAFFRRVIAWRWTPCVAPVMGSVMIALLTFLVVPDEIGSGAAGSGPLALHGKPSATSDASMDDASTDDPGSGAAMATRHSSPGSARHRAPADAVQGFFHKAQELPVEPVDPTPQPAPAEPPPPAPTATVFTLPEPAVTPPPLPAQPPIPAAPPPGEEPGTLPPPDVPLKPLGPP